MIPMGDVPLWHARRKPDTPAVVHAENALSWGDLARSVARRARALKGLGVREGDFVTISLPNDNAFVENLFAIWMAGGIPSPVSPRLPLAELRGILDLARPRVIIGGDPDTLRGWTTVPATWDGAGESEEPLPSPTVPYWKAMTSGGSTGRPKLIVAHRPTLVDPTMYEVWDSKIHHGRLGRPDGCVLNPGPLYHNGPFNLVFNNLFCGATLIGLLRFDPEETLRRIERHRVELLYMVPTMMHRIWNLPAEIREHYDLSSLRGVIHMAAPCPSWLKENWIRWLGTERIFECYGSTEAQGATLITGDEWLQRPGSVGRFWGYVQNARARILDEEGHELPPNEVGELFIMAPNGTGSTFHYIGAEPRIKDGWESVGDMGWLDEEGYLYLADRRTDLILRGGSNVYPAEVEAAIEAHPDVNASIVIGLPDEDLGARVHAIVELRPAARGKVDDRTLSEFLRERLVRYKIPASFEFIDTPLRDEAGKARRAALRADRLQMLKA